MTERLLNHTRDIFESALHEILTLDTKRAASTDAIVNAAAILTLADCVSRVDIDSSQLAKALDDANL